ncbi:MAG: SUF system NifU family Fe-S cluster assembly protein [Armatimonadetes bacterium]|nr:SUF system NifU family Fe-S cluster assembly protein [Armatimonadota bacterium]MDE2208026.1 SUF system NifU family Fe-S cluster assembly protein [Armatimonadota bacterium]
MADLDDLYQETILDHNRRPRNFGALPGANCTAEGYNPLCGDHIHVYARVEDGTIRELRFESTGCAISRASASLMTEALIGRTVEEADRLFAEMRVLLTGGMVQGDAEELMGKLAVLSGVHQFPTRIKCAVLAWHALDAALHQRGEVSTENEEAVREER